MYIVILGAGEVGSHLAYLLSQEQHDVVVIDIDRERINEVNSGLDVLTIHGSGVIPSILTKAGIAQADIFMAVTNSDQINILGTSLATRMGAKKAVVRLRDSEYREEYKDLIQEISQTSIFIDPDNAAAKQIVRLLEFQGALQISELGDGKMLLITAKIKEGSEVANKSLLQVAQEVDKVWDFLFVGLSRGDEHIIPRGDTTLLVDDEVRILTKKTSIKRVAKLLGLDQRAPKRVVILGGGEIAELVGRQIQYRVNNLCIIEKNKDRAEELDTAFPSAAILHGDITDIELLEEAEVNIADTVIALTGEDASNITSCMYAKEAGAKKAVAVVHQLSLLQMMRLAGIDAALSPRTASADAVLHLVHGGTSAVSTFIEGDSELLEFKIGPESPAANKKVMDLHLPKHVLIGSTLHEDGTVEIVRGTTTILPGDFVIVITPLDQVTSVTKFFTPDPVAASEDEEGDDESKPAGEKAQSEGVMSKLLNIVRPGDE